MSYIIIRNILKIFHNILIGLIEIFLTVIVLLNSGIVKINSSLQNFFKNMFLA